MIKITIERTTEVIKKKNERYCVSEKPTEIKRQRGYGEEEVQFERVYEVKEVHDAENHRETLLMQEVSGAAETRFDLNRVIAAINGME